MFDTFITYVELFSLSVNILYSQRMQMSVQIHSQRRGDKTRFALSHHQDVGFDFYLALNTHKYLKFKKRIKDVLTVKLL